MTEINKRYKVAIYDEKAIGGYCVLDLEKPSQTARLKYKNVYISSKAGCNIVCDLLNGQEELIKRLKTIREEQTETILKQKRKIKELETRNKRQYNRLKELTELMYERQWEKLENMVEEWEKQDELLQKEWHNYGDL